MGAKRKTDLSKGSDKKRNDYTKIIKKGNKTVNPSLG